MRRTILFWARGDEHQPLRKADDFAHVKDSVALEAFQDLVLLDKGRRRRSWRHSPPHRCGHPTKYRPGQKKASSFVEDVVGIVF